VADTKNEGDVAGPVTSQHRTRCLARGPMQTKVFLKTVRFIKRASQWLLSSESVWEPCGGKPRSHTSKQQGRSGEPKSSPGQ